MRRWILVASLLIGCSPDPGLEVDSGPAAREAGADSGQSPDPDGALHEDASGPQDSGESLEAGAALDAEAAADGGASDVGAEPDGGLVDAEADAAAADAGEVSDAALGLDSGASPDAALGLDAGASPDAALGLDAGASPDAGAQSCSDCLSYASPMNLGAVASSVLVEISGLAASRSHPSLLYAHNDSGGLPVIYGLGTGGQDLGSVTLAGATAIDWEDMALGPCPSGSCLYVGDIGDNGSNRAEAYGIYRIAEPMMLASTTSSVSYEYFEIAYPLGAHHNAETLLVHPTTGDVYVVTKTQFGAQSSVYKASAPLVSGAVNPLVLVADLPIPMGLELPITGGDIHPCGTAVLLRSYSTIYRLELPAGATNFDAIFQAPVGHVPFPPLGLGPSNELQGEAITWAPDGRGYYTVGERAGQQIHFVGCQ